MALGRIGRAGTEVTSKCLRPKTDWPLRPPCPPAHAAAAAGSWRFVRGVFTLVTVLVVIGAAGSSIVGWTVYQNYAADLPSADGLRTYQPPLMSRVYAGDDRLIAELASERRIFVPFTAIPDIVKKAFIAAEDKSFYQHKGVDPMAIARAAMTDLQRIGERRRPVGASTITQQVARNMLLGSNDVSFRRKVKEALLALHIERTLSKERILELYLNTIYLGQGSYGVAAAAQAYFNKPLDDLHGGPGGDAGGAAEIANQLQSVPRSRCRDGRGAIGSSIAWWRRAPSLPAEGKAAQAEDIGPDAYQRPATVPGSEWFANEVRRQLIERFGQDQSAQGGLIVHTSLDPALAVRRR